MPVCVWRGTSTLSLALRTGSNSSLKSSPEHCQNKHVNVIKIDLICYPVAISIL